MVIPFVGIALTRTVRTNVICTQAITRPLLVGDTGVPSFSESNRRERSS